VHRALYQVAALSVLAAFNGIVAVYFKENYNLFVTNTTHTILGSTIGFLLLLKAALSYNHYNAAKQARIRSICVWPADSLLRVPVTFCSYNCACSSRL